jgi:hypothetical protein
VVYRIDSNDTLVHVDGAFRRFAQAVGVPDLPNAVLGRSLWSCIADDELRAVYTALVARARAGHVVRVKTRCDSPSLMRQVDMDISPLPGGEVEIACTAGAARARAADSQAPAAPLRLVLPRRPRRQVAGDRGRRRRAAAARAPDRTGRHARHLRRLPGGRRRRARDRRRGPAPLRSAARPRVERVGGRRRRYHR